jgi:uncharacterized membrane protein
VRVALNGTRAYDERLRENPLFILALLSLLVVVSEQLVRRSALTHAGSALIVIILGAVASNVGLIPSGSTEQAPVPIYDIIFAYVAPAAIFWLLLQVNLRDVLRAGLPLVALFMVGAVGTMLGAVVGMRLIGGADVLGALHAPLAGMFAATYIGGSVNFNAIALEYNVVRDGVLYGGAVVVDNIITAFWIAVTLAVPRFLAPLWNRSMAAPEGKAARADASVAAPIIDLPAETEVIDPRKLALVITLGAGALFVSRLVTDATTAAGFPVPFTIVVTTLALVLAQIPGVSAIPGSRAVGMYCVYVFLAVIGAFCDVRAMAGLGTVGLSLMVLAFVVVVLHGAIIYSTARLFRMDVAAASVASQANIGGSTSALALAKSLGREDLLVPGILLGALGNAIGTFLGLAVVRVV